MTGLLDPEQNGADTQTAATCGADASRSRLSLEVAAESRSGKRSRYSIFPILKIFVPQSGQVP